MNLNHCLSIWSALMIVLLCFTVATCVWSTQSFFHLTSWFLITAFNFHLGIHYSLGLSPCGCLSSRSEQRGHDHSELIRFHETSAEVFGSQKKRKKRSSFAKRLQDERKSSLELLPWSCHCWSLRLKAAQERQSWALRRNWALNAVLPEGIHTRAMQLGDQWIPSQTPFLWF